MSRWGPHNEQTVLDLSKDESYLYVKNNLSKYKAIEKQIEEQSYAIDDWGDEEEFFIKRKRLKRKILSRLNRAMDALEDITLALYDEKRHIEHGIINNALSAPIMPRKVDLMKIQSSNDISVNDDLDYDIKLFNPLRSTAAQNRENK